ncbi:MAG TPA: MmgE/PrpD family protein, partial [Paraburkholderia sp.]
MQTAAALAATSLPTSRWAFAADSQGDIHSNTPADVTGQLARYMVASRDAALPGEVATACKNHILDTLGAIMSGSRMRPGELATRYVRSLGGTPQAWVVGSNLRTTCVNAALANAMCAHSDETDDFEPVTKAHPGCSVVPAALAIGEYGHASGDAFMRAVALGYDMACRLLMALGPDLVRASNRSAEGTASTFGSVGAAASLAKLDERATRFALSYAAQQESGLWSWVKDKDHIEKAFDFAGMGARNGV